MSENINSLKEEWYNDTITGKVAKKFKEIISKKWEKIFLLKDWETKEYLNKFEYKNRELSTRTVYQNSEVWDFDIWEWTYCVSLGDIAIYPDFYKAIKEVEKEEWINFHITESIWLDDCLSMIWKSLINFKEVAENAWLRDGDSIDKILLQICNDINQYLKPEFSAKIDYTEHKLFLQAFGENKQNILNRDPSFTNKIKKVAEYFNKNKENIFQSFMNSAQEEQKKNEAIKKEQMDKYNNLKKQL